MVHIDQWSDCKLRFVHSNDTHYDWHCQSFYVRMVTLKKSLIAWVFNCLLCLFSHEADNGATWRPWHQTNVCVAKFRFISFWFSFDVNGTWSKSNLRALCLVRASNMGYMHLGLQSRAKENKVRNINTDMRKGNWTKIFLKLTWN